MTGSAILWRRLDLPGHDSARLSSLDPGWRLAGTAVFAYQGEPCRLEYVVVCDADWRTVSAAVAGWVGDEIVQVEITVGPDRRWLLNGTECPDVAGCLDVDLNFSPSTNLLPIRRLHLSVGEDAAVRAAWLRFPGFRLEPLDQIYRRTAEAAYRYESGEGTFVRDLEVGPTGFVKRYPGFWEVEESITPRAAPRAESRVTRRAPRRDQPRP